MTSKFERRCNMKNNSKSKTKKKHLEYSDRIKINFYINQNFSVNKIAKELNRSPSIICREIQRNIIVKEGNPLLKEYYVQGKSSEDLKLFVISVKRLLTVILLNVTMTVIKLKKWLTNDKRKKHLKCHLVMKILNK